LLANFAKEVTAVIDKHSKIDWHENTEVHNRIAYEIDDLLYNFTKKNGIELTFDQIDKIIENVKTVALRRY